VRVLGIDHGRSRTGLALSDPLGLICSPLATIQERDEERLIADIVGVAKNNDVGRIVLGLPRPLSGGSNRQLESVLSFKLRLESQAAVPVLTWDERFTSKLAEKGARHAVVRDSVAACYMLQNYLDSRSNSTGDE
jgi:putative Holliday junction resolvase